MMMDNVNEVIDKISISLKNMEKGKAHVAKAYNKKVKSKSVTKLGGSLERDQSDIQ